MHTNADHGSGSGLTQSCFLFATLGEYQLSHFSVDVFCPPELNHDRYFDPLSLPLNLNNWKIVIFFNAVYQTFFLTAKMSSWSNCIVSERPL